MRPGKKTGRQVSLTTPLYTSLCIGLTLGHMLFACRESVELLKGHAKRIDEILLK